MEEELPSGYKYCECGKCKELVMKIDVYGRDVRFAPGHNSKGSNNPQYRGGKENHKQFKYKSKKDRNHPNADVRGNIRVHVWVYTTYHKCCMLKWGQVHHIDGNILNNDISNLEGVMRGNHRRDHMAVDMSGRICKLCNGTKTWDRHWYRYEDGYMCALCRDKLRRYPLEIVVDMVKKGGA